MHAPSGLLKFESFKAAPAWSGACLILLFCFCLPFSALAVEVNSDGAELIKEARQTFEKDINKRSVNSDPALNRYVKQLIKHLVPKNKSLPAGVSLNTVIVESVQPELYSYTSGQIVLTTGLLLSVENEAQLAGVMSREVANIVEGYYITLYQEIKAAQRQQQRKEAAAAFLGDLLDVAVDFGVRYASYDISEKWFRDEITYKETMMTMAGVYAAEKTYYNIRDMIENIPEKDEKGQWVDPRLRIEPIADAQGLVYMATAGYDCSEAATGWTNLYREKQRLLQDREAAMGPWAEQMRQTRAIMEMSLKRMQTSFGRTGLVQTRGSIPHERAEFIGNLSRGLEEVKEAQKQTQPRKGIKAFQALLSNYFVPRAQKLMADEEYEKAAAEFSALWSKGIKTAPVAYGMAKSEMGDFAFGASEAEKKAAEKAYLDAARMDKTFADAHRGLAELYEDWERYADAAASYERYLKLSPKAFDRKRVLRKIKTCKKRANR